MADSKSSAAFGAFKTLIATPTLPDLGPGPRAGVQMQAYLNQPLEEYFRKEKSPASLQPLLRAAALLWHDHHDAAHVLVQEEPGAEGSFLHGILHRREPDYGNARYWFRRVGQHPCFPLIAEKAAVLLDQIPERELKFKLLRQGAWNSCAFIDACEAAADLPAAPARTQLLQQIQAVEFETLVAFMLQRG